MIKTPTVANGVNGKENTLNGINGATNDVNSEIPKNGIIEAEPEAEGSRRIYAMR